jgi:hypothetical protein
MNDEKPKRKNEDAETELKREFMRLLARTACEVLIAFLLIPALAVIIDRLFRLLNG